MIQSPAGGPYGSPGQFTNFADPAVRRYNLAIALGAVDRGVDDILWDDTRRPGGDQAGMVIPGLSGSPSDSIAGFLAEAHSELRRRGAYQGVTTDGEAADQGELVGQDVARIAANSDYVAPQIFPGYWSPGTTWPVRSTSQATSCVACSSGSSRRPPTGARCSLRGCRTSRCAV